MRVHAHVCLLVGGSDMYNVHVLHVYTYTYIHMYEGFCMSIYYLLLRNLRQNIYPSRAHAVMSGHSNIFYIHMYIHVHVHACVQYIHVHVYTLTYIIHVHIIYCSVPLAAFFSSQSTRVWSGSLINLCAIPPARASYNNTQELAIIRCYFNQRRRNKVIIRTVYISSIQFI